MGPETPGPHPDDLPPEGDPDDAFASDERELTPEEQGQQKRFSDVDQKFTREFRDLTAFCRSIDPAYEEQIEDLLEAWDDGLSETRGYVEAAEARLRHIDAIRQFRDRVITAHPDVPYPWNLVQPGAEEASHVYREELEKLELRMQMFEDTLRASSSTQGLERLQQLRDALEAGLLMAGKDPHERLKAVIKKRRAFSHMRTQHRRPGSNPP